MQSPMDRRTEAGDRAEPGTITIEHLAAGRDIVITLAQVASASKFSAKIQSFFEEYLISESGGDAPATVPFGGRNEEFELLDRWLDDDEGERRFVLAAPAGRGKSALLVRWIRHLEGSKRIGERRTIGT
jgi:hypothetical protein